MKDEQLKDLLTQAFREGREGMTQSTTPGFHSPANAETGESPGEIQSPPGLAVGVRNPAAGSTPGFPCRLTASRRTWILSAAAMLAVMMLSFGGFQAWRSYTIHQMALEETVKYLEDLMDRT